MTYKTVRVDHICVSNFVIRCYPGFQFYKTITPNTLHSQQTQKLFIVIKCMFLAILLHLRPQFIIQIIIISGSGNLRVRHSPYSPSIMYLNISLLGTDVTQLQLDKKKVYLKIRT